MHVADVNGVDADAGNELPIDRGPEGQMGEYRQLLRGVAAVDVHGGIGFGEAEFLRLSQGRGVGLSRVLHLRENEIACSVKYAVNRLDLVGHQRLSDGSDDRNSPSHGGLKGDRPADGAAQSNNSAPCSASTALFAVITFLPLCSTLSMIDRSGSNPPISCTTASISGSLSIVETSVLSRPGGGLILRGRRMSASTIRTNSTLRPTWRETRSECSSNILATPDPMVPKPIKATFAVEFVIV